MKPLLAAVSALALTAAASPALSQGAASQGSGAPDIPFDAVNFLKVPLDNPIGEAAGVATNSKGHVFVFTRTGNPTLVVGGSRTFATGGSKLYEYDQNGNFVREIGKGVYGFLAAHVVRIDPQDNIWTVDENANVVIKFAPDGSRLMTLGRKPEALGGKPAANPGLGVAGDTFDGPADVAWDAKGNIFVADGTRNARVVKLDKDGGFIKAWGGRGTGPGQFSNLHTLQVDAQGNVYVGDRANNRIEVFDNDGTFKTELKGFGSPVAICISGGPHPYLFSSNSNGESTMDGGEIYKMELDGRIVGKFGRAGKRLKEFGALHEIDCRDPSSLFVAEIVNWRVQKLSLRAR